MKIRKAFQGTVPDNKILDTYSASQTDTYSCNYVNNIVASGSNTNGNYVKYVDGTMICWGNKTGSSSKSDWWGFSDRTDEISVTYPQEFTTYPRLTIGTYSSDTTNGSITNVITNQTKTGFKTFTLFAKNSSNNHYDFNFIAVGKWK